MPDAEIGYIAMHLGSAIEALKNQESQSKTRYKVVVTCTSGIGTSKMLAERIRSEFNQIDIEAILSTTQISEVWLLEKNVDLIISTVHFDNRLTPVVMVNPLLLDTDIQKIKGALSSTQMMKKSVVVEPTSKLTKSDLNQMAQTTLAAVELLNHLKIDDDIQVASIDALVHHITQRLELDAQAQAALTSDIFAREALGSVIFKEDRVLFLHTRSDVLDAIHVLVIRHTTLKYQSAPCDASLVLLAPEKMEAHALDAISEISRLTVSDPTFLSQLKELETMQLFERFERYMAQYVMQHNRSLTQS
jgi:mannitol operon transcriptional antiterminator